MEFERVRPSIIKVIGVGGGGCNAVNHMCREGIQGVEFVVCNTDAQSLEASPVINKIQLGSGLTDGLGAGNDPIAGRDAAQESIEDIRELFSDSTKMVFITAGMGGGTGTGAAPVIASVAREMDVLSVGIVTEPFSFEGAKRIKQAEEGIRELRKNVDSLIIICNDKLRQLYGSQKLKEAFARADNVLATAARGIAEIITVSGHVNVDFKDVKTVMKDSGVAIMGIGIAEGENRALKAAELALNSPLLNDNQIKGAKNILVNITSGTEEIDLDELGTITDYIQEEAGKQANIIWGHSTDAALEKKVSVNVVAAGFESSGQQIMAGSVPENLIAPKILKLDDKRNEVVPETSDNELLNFGFRKKDETDISTGKNDSEQPAQTVKYSLFEDNLNETEEKKDPENNVNNVFEFPSDNSVDNCQPEKESLNFELKKVDNIGKSNNDIIQPAATKTSLDRINKLKDLSMKIRTCDGLDEIEKEPAYKRRGVELTQTPDPRDTDISDSSASLGSGGVQISKGNTYLHDNID